MVSASKNSFDQDKNDNDMNNNDKNKDKASNKKKLEKKLTLIEEIKLYQIEHLLNQKILSFERLERI